MCNKYIFQPYWDYLNNQIDESTWKSRFSRATSSANAASRNHHLFGKEKRKMKNNTSHVIPSDKPEKNRIGIFIGIFFLILTIIGSGAALAQSGDIKTLIKQANQELRTSERNMYSGKNDEAITGIQSVQKIISSIKEQDPENRQIKTLESKATRLIKSLERKTGRDLGAGTTTVKKSTKTKLPPKPQVGEAHDSTKLPPKPQAVEARDSSKLPPKPLIKTDNRQRTTASAPAQTASGEKLPYQVRELLKGARSDISSAESKVEKFDLPRFARLTLTQKAKMVEHTASSARKKLDEAKQLATEKGITEHPEFTELEGRLAKVNAKVASDTALAEKQEQGRVKEFNAMQADFDKLQAEQEKAEQKLQKYTGGKAIYYNRLEEAEAMYSAIDNFEHNDKQALIEQQKAFGDKYGNTEQAINDQAKSVGFHPTYHSPCSAYIGIAQLVQNVDLSKTAMAEGLAQHSNRMIAGALKKRHEFTVREDYQDARKWLALGAKFDPNNAVVQQEQKTIDARIDAGLKEFFARIDARTWPPDSEEGSSKYAAEAKDYFVQSKAWAKRDKDPYKILNLIISGPWSVQKKDAFKRPVMYGLPVIVAVQLERDKKDDLARVFHLTLRTPESHNPTTAPPFTSDTVGGSYFIRKSKVN